MRPPHAQIAPTPVQSVTRPHNSGPQAGPASGSTGNAAWRPPAPCPFRVPQQSRPDGRLARHAKAAPGIGERLPILPMLPSFQHFLRMGLMNHSACVVYLTKSWQGRLNSFIRSKLLFFRKLLNRCKPVPYAHIPKNWHGICLSKGNQFNIAKLTQKGI